jgi:DnaJ-class molecular chaperone
MGNSLCACQCIRCSGHGMIRNPIYAPYIPITTSMYVICTECNGQGTTHLSCNLDKCPLNKPFTYQ